MDGRTRVVILFGGRSAEHEVSILSARNVLAALDRTRFNPILIGIDKQGRWRAQSERLLAGATGDPRQLRLEDEAPVVALSTAPSSITEVLDRDDVVFPVLHGTYGEDGTVQGLLELADVAYVGAGVLGSAIGMDKDVAKRLLRDAGIPIVDFRVVSAADVRDDPQAAAAQAAALGYPLFVKPANAGSSVGVSKVITPAALVPAMRAALAFDRKVLLERAVDAREIEVAVLGNDHPIASVPGEIVVHHRDGFYSYDAKYVDADGAAWKIPAELPPALAQRIQELAVATFRALELAGMARVDFFVDKTTAQVFVNEVNTIPGFTAISMYPKMWEASGIPIRDLVNRLINLAIERRDARRCLCTTVPGP
ncbi:MAG TPA: D-alanine--D-alanine ligase family protein [Polyangia bacterium]|jgi:D-alanine-D-alanine ligase|nr:D-alanine--D-alanine ligase family protein [Polyangia bacterium]